MRSSEASVWVARRALLLTVGLLALALGRWIVGPSYGDSSDLAGYLRAAGEVERGADPYASYYTGAMRATTFDEWSALPVDYNYPPLLAIALIPLSHLPFDAAVRLWAALNLIAMVGIVLALRYLLGGLRFDRIMLLLAVVAANFVPFLLDLQYGQVDIILAALITLAYALSRAQRPWQAGLPFGLAIAIKPQLAPLLVFFLWMGQWPVLVSALTSGFLLGVGPFAILGWQTVGDFTSVIRWMGSSQYAAWSINQGPSGFVRRALGAPGWDAPLVSNPVLIVPVLAASSVAAGAVWLRATPRLWRGTDDRTALRVWSFTLVVWALVSPILQPHHFSYLYVPIALGAVEFAEGALSPSLSVLAIGCVLFFSFPWLAIAPQAGHTRLIRLAASGTWMYGLGALAVLSWRVVGHKRETAVGPVIVDRPAESPEPRGGRPGAIGA